MLWAWDVEQRTTERVGRKGWLQLATRRAEAVKNLRAVGRRNIRLWMMEESDELCLKTAIE